MSHGNSSHRVLPALEAWVLARILGNQPLNGELALVPPPLRTLAERLAEMPPDHRPPLLEGYSLRLADPGGFLKAIALADRDGPAPAAGSAPPGEVPTGDGDPRPAARLIRASTLTSRPIEGLWDGRVPLGMLSLFGGDPGLGKSFVTLDLASAVSRGAPAPHGDTPDDPGSVILMSAEDDPARVIVPRLQAAGADLAKIHILESIVISEGIEALPSLRTDMLTIEEAVRGVPDCRLIVVDPVSAYLDGIDDHKNAPLRGVLSPLKALAERLNVAVVLVTHLAKGGGANAKYRAIGSIAYVGAARAYSLFVRDPDDPTGRRVLMLHGKANLGPPPPGLAYVIEDRGDGPGVEWLAETIDKDADTILREIAEAEAQAGDRARSAVRRDCEDWLRQLLAVGPKGAEEVFAQGREAGYSQDQLQRAKVAIGAKSAKKSFGKGWAWTLGPAPSRTPGGDEGRTSGRRSQSS
jgi:hypothetical protein